MWHVGCKIMEICSCSPEPGQKRLLNTPDTLSPGQKDHFEFTPNGRLDTYRSIVSEDIQSEDMICEDTIIKRRSRFRQRIDEVCSYYLQHSTFHGLHYMFDSKSLLRRAMWFIILCVASGVFFYEMKKSVTQFFLYPFSTLSTLEYSDDLLFPAVTICDFNNVQSIAIKDEASYYAANGKILDPLNMSIEELLDKASKRFQRNIVDCRWKRGELSTPCSGSNFSIFVFPTGEVCHTFNSGRLKGQKIMKATNIGPKYGLSLYLNVMQGNYSKTVQQSGFRVILHQRGELPLRKEGFRVAPGYVAYVGLLKQKIQNLRSPYATNCGGKQLKYFSSYSRTNCYLEAVTDFVKEKCGCVGWFMPGADGAKMCQLARTIKCLWPAWEEFDKTRSIDCPVDCEGLTYTPKLSSALFYPEKLLPVQKFHWLLKGEGMPSNRSEQLRFMRENYVVINLFFEELRYEKITQVPSYGFYRLVGDLGGQIGLVLGASCISIVEALDVFAVSLYYWIRHRRMKGNKDNLNV